MTNEKRRCWLLILLREGGRTYIGIEDRKEGVKVIKDFQETMRQLIDGLNNKDTKPPGIYQILDKASNEPGITTYTSAIVGMQILEESPEDYELRLHNMRKLQREKEGDAWRGEDG